MMMSSYARALGRRFRRLFPRRLLRPATFSAFYRIEVFDPEGTLVRDSGLLPSHSFVFQFLQIIFSCMSKTDSAGGKDTGGVARTIDASALAYDRILACDAAAGATDRGIRVGTGAGGEDNMDYALTTPVAEGTGGGQLTHQVATFTAVAEVGPNVDMEAIRTFTNESGGTIPVTEIALYTATPYTTNQLGYYCILRDEVTQEDIPDGYTLKVTYTLRTTV